MYASGVLYWVDITGKDPSPSFNVYNPATGVNTRYYLPSRVGTVVPSSVDEGNLAWLALEDGAYTLDLTARTLTKIVDMRAPGDAVRMNDGKCDPMGRFWVRDCAVTARARVCVVRAGDSCVVCV